MELKKISKKPENLSTNWFSWPTDKGMLLLLSKDNIKRYNKRKKAEGFDANTKPYNLLPNEVGAMGGMSDKDIRMVFGLLSRRARLISAISKAEASGEDASTNISKVNVYNEALSKYIPILSVRDNLDTIDLHTASDISRDISPLSSDKPDSKNKRNKLEQDLDIVTALNYVGVTVEKDDLGTYAITKHKNGNGIKYYVGKSQKTFTLSKKASNKYINDFLNKPLEARKFMTASQVFADYISECEKSFGVSEASASDLKTLFGSEKNSSNPSVYFKDVIKSYSRHAKSWQTFKKDNVPEVDKKAPNDYGMPAKKIAIGGTLAGVLNDQGVLSQKQVENIDYKVGNISKDFGLDFDAKLLGDESKFIEALEDRSFRTISLLHSTLQELKAYGDDVIEEAKSDYSKKSKIHQVLDAQRGDYLSKKIELEKQIAELKKDTANDNSKEIKFFEKKLEKVQAKLDSEEYSKANADYLISRNNFRRILCLSKYYDSLLADNIALKKEKAKLQRKPVAVEEVVEIIKKVLGDENEPTIKIQKGKIEIDGMSNKREYKKNYPLVEVDKQIRVLSGEEKDETKPKESPLKDIQKNKDKKTEINNIKVDFGDIRGKLKNLRGSKKSIKSKTKEPTGTTINRVSLSGNLGVGVGKLSAKPKSENANVEVYEDSVVERKPTQKSPLNRTSIQSNVSNENAYNDEVTRELMAILLEEKKREIEERKSKVIEDDDASESSPKVEPSKKKSTEETLKKPENKKKDIFSQMLDYEKDETKLKDLDSLDNHEEVLEKTEVVEPKEVATPKVENVDIAYSKHRRGKSTTIDDDIMDMLSGDDDGYDIEIEPAILPYFVSYQKDGKNVYGVSLERFATFERYRYLIETKGNLLSNYVTSKIEMGVSADDIITDIKYRILKASLSRSNLTLDDSVIASINLSDVKSELVPLIDRTAVTLVSNDYMDMLDSIDFDILKFVIGARMLSTVIDTMPDDIRDDMAEALNMLGSVVSAITADRRSASTFEKYSGKMKQNYIDQVIAKIEAGEIPKRNLDSAEMYGRMLDYLSFSISAQNVIIQKIDASDGGLTNYPRNVYFAEKENADNALRLGKPLSYEQNLLLTKRNSSMFDDLDGNVVNLFGSLFPFSGAYNKLLIRLKPNVLKSGVKFMENIVDALRVAFLAKQTSSAQNDEDYQTVSIKNESQKPFDYEDDDWFVRLRFVLDKQKAQEYAIQLALGMKYGIDPSKSQLKADFYENNMLSLSKINNVFKGLDENTISMLTSAIRTMMTQRVDRYDDFVERLNSGYLIYANKMIYIAEELQMLENFEDMNAQLKRNAIDRLEAEFVAKSEDTTEIYPELTSPRRMVNSYIKQFRFYALIKLFENFGKDERIVTKKFAEEFESIKYEMRKSLIDEIKGSTRLNGYEIEIAKYFELDIVVHENSRDNVDLVEKKEEVLDEVEVENIDVIFAGIRNGLNLALDEMNDLLLREDEKHLARVLDITGSFDGELQNETFEVKMPNGETIRCNIKGLLQQYILRGVIGTKEDIVAFEYIIEELKRTDHIGEFANHFADVLGELKQEKLGINLIVPFSELSSDGKTLNLGEAISTVMGKVRDCKTYNEVETVLSGDKFFEKAVQEIKEQFVSYLKKKKSEQIVF